MTEKLDIYDILNTLILGILAICSFPLLFPAALLSNGPKYPDGFLVLALVASSLFVGQLIQAISSLIEPVLFKTFGGRPSDLALSGKLGDWYFNKEEAERIKSKIIMAMGGNATSNSSVFRFAMQKSDAAGIGRAARFNALYAYHRVVFVLTLGIGVLLLASMKWGAAAKWQSGPQFISILGVFLLLLLFWHRTKQRGIYYAREVLATTERVLDEKLITAMKPTETPPGKG